MNIIVSKIFPKGKGVQKETGFKSAILNGTKIHTIRTNVEYWEKLNPEWVYNGAKSYFRYKYLKVMEWSGLPYRSKTNHIYTVDFPNTQRVYKDCEGNWYVRVEEYYYKIDANILAKNDGLSIEDFNQFFADIAPYQEMIIIFFKPVQYEVIGGRTLIVALE